MRKILLVVSLLALGGCASFFHDAGAILGGTVGNPLTPRAALQLHTTFDGGVVVAAGDYAYLPRCPAPAPCSDQKIVNQLRVYVNGAEDTLRQLDQWALGNTALNGPALYQAALIAVATAQQFATQTGLRFAPATGT